MSGVCLTAPMIRYFAIFYAISSSGIFSIQCPDGWSESSFIHDKCYRVVTTRKMWFDAEYFCRKQAPSAHLVSIQNAYETANIKAIVIDTPSISICDQLWIGANDVGQPGTFIWTDGQPFIYKKWGGSQPDLRYMCVSSKARTSGEWQTDQCGEENCFICEYNKTAPTIPPTANMTDCYDWLHIGGARTSGIYEIQGDGYGPFNVYCDMSTDGGGWTVFQKRQDDSVDFNRTWTDYKNGFRTEMDTNFWLGLDKIHVISAKDSNVVLRIDLHGNRCLNEFYCSRTDFDANGYWFGEWGFFKIDNETQQYRLNIARATDGNITSLDQYDFFFGWSNHQVFSTVDCDNNGFSKGNCASAGGSHYGAWWYAAANCGSLYLNGRYDSSPQWGPNGMAAYHTNFIKNYWINPMQSEMKLRKKLHI